MKYLIIVACCLSILVQPACVGSKKFKTKVAELESLKSDYNKIEDQLRTCLTSNEDNLKKRKELEEEVANLKASSNNLLTQLSNLSVISTTQAESIKKSLENINSKDAYIKDLQVAMNKKDSLNMALVLNLKGALGDINDQDVEIKVEQSAVFISISDKMLFKSGSYEISPAAKAVLAKVAAVLNAQPEVQVMVEGHTDNKPISTSSIKDNWDLSALRATAVTRVLQNDYKVDPKRMIAAGRSEYQSIDSNDTVEGRSKNRRTRIVILPELDQFFKLMEPK